MSSLINRSSDHLRHYRVLIMAWFRRCLESLVFWVLGGLRDLHDALLAFDLIRGLVIYALEPKCCDVVMANVRSPRFVEMVLLGKSLGLPLHPPALSSCT